MDAKDWGFGFYIFHSKQGQNPASLIIKHEGVVSTVLLTPSMLDHSILIFCAILCHQVTNFAIDSLKL